MTATRWWVQSGARWIARIKGVQGQLNLFFTAMTGVSLASGVLRYFGLPAWAIAAFVVVVLSGVIGFAYLYSEGGVWNQVRLDEKQMSDNFLGPTARLDDELIGIAVYAAIHNEVPDKESVEVIQAAVDGRWREDLRDGVEVSR